MNKNDNPLVSVILVNYNGYEDTKECVISLLTCGYSNLKIIIVDNASNINKAIYDEVIKKPQCEILELEENIGFAGGNNKGIQLAKKYGTDYYLILNNDTIVRPGFLQPLLAIAKNDSQVGIVTGKILYYDDPGILWYGGGCYDDSLGEMKIRGIGEQDSEQYNKRELVPFATGCLWLLPNIVVEDVGYMCEDYFLYYEDADYCARVRKKGYKIVYEPMSVILHKESRTTKKGSDQYQYFVNRNYLFYIKTYITTNRMKFYWKRACMILRSVVRKRMKISVAYKIWKDFLLNNRGNLLTGDSK